MTEVLDAETGERLELLMQPSPTTSKPATPSVPSPSRLNPKSKSKSKSKSELQQPLPPGGVTLEMQPRRTLGDCVDWQQQQVARVENAELRFRESLAGVRHELQRPGLSKTVRLDLTAELLEKTKRRYAQQVQTLVVEELAREMEREVAIRVELSTLGRERMQRRHDQERALYRSQIARVRDECEMALTAAAAKRNLLR
ncbi:hypothetical protein BBJ28_00003984 [Nothophytophthora sp. Chile5]|nr:hypothetical protein BBJ28_00003984 [Nothophytophthora sp. Chile5]